MAAFQQDETERKFDVDASTVFPNLATLDAVASVGQPSVFDLEAVYFDTSQLDLVRQGVTLRRRTGGTDEGWHLKLPAHGDTRTEVRERLEGAPDAVPDGLLARVGPLVLDRPLAAVATVRTRRKEYALRDSRGVVLARVCDDTVQAGRLRDGRERNWREWEVELDAAPAELLDAVAKALIAAGASPATSPSKLRRTLGKIPSARPSEGPRLPEGSVGRLLGDHLAQQLARVREHDAGVRAGHHEAVHRLRIAARRLRSALSTFRPILDRDVTDPVQAELRWLGASLAPARDAQVLREHLLATTSSEPTDLVIGPTMTHIDDQLRSDHRSGMEKAREALNSERYAHLLAILEGLAASPPLRSDPDRRAADVMPRLLARDLKRLNRAVDGITEAAPGDERDRAFHEARKKAKRLRYAAETAVPALGKHARALARSSKRAQQFLGEHQDSVNARARLRELAMQVHLSGGNSFTFGRLHALEQVRAERAEADFAKHWKHLRRKHFERWIR